MLSQEINQSNKSALSDIVAGVFYDTGESVIKEQHGIAESYYTRRSGELVRNLASRPFNVMKSFVNAQLIFNYLKHIRFLDLKRTATGKKKRNYQPIYNKPLYGYIYNFTYAKLRYGLSQTLKEQSVDPLKTVFNQPIEIVP
jgi:hypothetical protein